MTDATLNQMSQHDMAARDQAAEAAARDTDTADGAPSTPRGDRTMQVHHNPITKDTWVPIIRHPTLVSLMLEFMEANGLGCPEFADRMPSATGPGRVRKWLRGLLPDKVHRSAFAVAMRLTTETVNRAFLMQWITGQRDLDRHPVFEPGASPRDAGATLFRCLYDAGLWINDLDPEVHGIDASAARRYLRRQTRIDNAVAIRLEGYFQRAFPRCDDQLKPLSAVNWSLSAESSRTTTMVLAANARLGQIERTTVQSPEAAPPVPCLIPEADQAAAVRSSALERLCALAATPGSGVVVRISAVGGLQLYYETTSGDTKELAWPAVEVGAVKAIGILDEEARARLKQAEDEVRAAGVRLALVSAASRRTA